MAKQKAVLITGTSTGIGAACVARQAAAGWKVYAGVRKPEDGDRLVDEIDGDVVPVQLDVTVPSDIAGAVQVVADDHGSLDGLVNNAGIGVGGPIELLSDERWRWQMDVNFFGLVNMTRAAFPLVDRAGGRFVHIGSVAGRIGMAGLGPYNASKFAVQGFNWALRGELIGTGMNTSLIEPGEIKTPIWDKADDMLGQVEAMIDQAGKRERYGDMLTASRGFQHEGETKGVEADRVAKAVEHALTSRRPKPRYLVGPDAQAAAVIGRLPDRLLEPLLRLSRKRYMSMGRKLD